MSIIKPIKNADGIVVDVQVSSLTPEDIAKGLKDGNVSQSEYVMSDEEKDVRAMILKHFTYGYMTMYQPRVEFNDLSVIQRMQVDQMAFNTYQPANGQAPFGDEINSWKSRAIRPIVRNKCISIAAHATARLIFPKVFSYSQENEEERDAAQIMEDLMEWSADQSNYAHTSLYRVLGALTDPVSIGYTEYTEVYRKVKRPTEKPGVYEEETILDETMSGFQDTIVPCDELFIENFYEPNVQKQGWLIWRRVMSYTTAEEKYKGLYDNWKYVNPGIQLFYNDPNQTFYQVYDTQMSQTDVEEIVYWNKALDLKIIMVNGVMLTPANNPNPRLDKLYPFDTFGYEIINSRCFYYKSLAFKLMHDANIVNTLYPMIIDGTYLNLMPPMIQVGEEVIDSDVIVPGQVTTLKSKDADLRPVNTSNNLKAGLDALFKVDESVNESSQDPIQQGQSPSGSPTAYQISRMEQNAATVLGLFIKMIGKHVKEYGRLRLSDIVQYLTIADVSDITEDAPLVYKTFILNDKQSNGRTRSRKIQFDSSLPMGAMGEEELENMSFDILEEEGGPEAKMEIYKANPELFRTLKYKITVSPDVLNPRSEDLERAYDIEAFDKMISQPMLFDQEEAARLFLGTNPRTKKDPDKYLVKTMGSAPAPVTMPQQGATPTAGSTSLPQTAPSLGQI